MVLSSLKRGLAIFPPGVALRKRLFFAGHVLKNYKVHGAWIDASYALSARRGIDRPPYALREKTMRPYINLHWRSAQRLKAVTGHYEIAETLIPSAAQSALWHNQAVRIASIGTRDESYAVVLEAANDCRQEGELSLTMIDAADGVPLARLTFAFGRQDGRLALYIGGLQGQPAHLDKKRIVRATRQVGGLRPKSVVTTALQFLAERWGIDTVLAVSRANHVAGEKSARFNAEFTADYDLFWRERQATDDSVLGFRLPSATQFYAGKLDEMPERKRKFIIALRDQCATALA